jgi:hypothetical protein
MRARRVGDERTSRLLGRDREAAIVLRQVDLAQEAVRGLGRGDAGQRQLLGQTVLQGAEGALGAPPCLGRIGRNVLDAELGERPADLGRLIPGDLLPRLWGVEVMAATVGVERTRQAVGRDHLGERPKAALGAFLLDQEGRVDRGGGVVQGHNQIELLFERRQPAVGRAVLMQQHAGQRPSGPLLAVRRAPRRLGDQPGLVQAQLGPGVAQREAVPAHQLVVEVSGREAAVVLTVEAHYGVHLVHRHPSGRGLAQPPVEQPRRPFAFIAIPPAAERALAHPQDLRRLGLAQLPPLPPPPDVLEPHPPQSLQHLRPPHPPLPLEGPESTGQIACYQDRSYRVLSTRGP